MDHSFLAKLRVAVGLLGEKDQAGWWGTSFFKQQSSAFLTPLFPRNVLLAQCQGATAAAMRLHDERIGVGNVYHLFRLPEDLERGVFECVASRANAFDITELNDKERAAIFLEEIAARTVNEPNDGAGPIRIGTLSDIRNRRNWEAVATKYANGLKSKTEVFPFFASVT